MFLLCSDNKLYYVKLYLSHDLNKKQNHTTL